jgi:hypothetical protein
MKIGLFQYLTLGANIRIINNWVLEIYLKSFERQHDGMCLEASGQVTNIVISEHSTIWMLKFFSRISYLGVTCIH